MTVYTGKLDLRSILVKSDLNVNVNARMWTEIDLNECEHFLKANWDRSEIDLNEREHFLKANWDRSKLDQSYSMNGP